MRQEIRTDAPEPSATTRYRRLKFTDRTVLALKPSDKRLQYWDDSLPGFGLRVSPPNRKSPTGRKTWIVMYRRPTGSAVRLKLGTYPAVGLADARVKAKGYLGQIEIEGARSGCGTTSGSHCRDLRTVGRHLSAEMGKAGGR
jgi:hypothetical protein